jgi:site-specific DNA-adenine methylase
MKYQPKIGIPYMGSKRKIANKIVNFIIDQHQEINNFYDVFGGGGAISFEALQKHQIKSVHYNDLNSGVVNLLRKIQKDGVTEEFYEWVSREEFNKFKNGDSWRNGLIKTCWSFGNNQADYLYGKEKEEYYKSIFLERDCRIRHGLNQLKRIANLSNIKELQITNNSWGYINDIDFKENDVTYLDPPYLNTSKYQCDISHDELNDFIKSTKATVYISSYEWFDLEPVLSIEHRSSLSATNNNKKVIENLYCNKKVKKKKEIVQPPLF